jgi:propanol-preferring alcohol dehydrogenase
MLVRSAGCTSSVDTGKASLIPVCRKIYGRKKSKEGGLEMKAMVLRKVSQIEAAPLELRDWPLPQIGPEQIIVRVAACGVCHTELDEIEGRRQPKLPVIPGHEIVGRVEKLGPAATRFRLKDRVGIAWIFSSCGKCVHCQRGEENLCDQFQGTGCDADGGYAEYTVVPEDFAYPIPASFSDVQAAPLLCAGAIGYRALRLTGIQDGLTLGLYGFGASAHLVIQIAKYKYPNSKVFVFTRQKGDAPSQLAKEKGADWVGMTGEASPEKLDCAIDTTPAGIPVREALSNLNKGGRLVINVIRKETPVPELDYTEHLWEEKEIKSVANITRKDVQEFLPLAAEIPISSEINEFRLEEANQALLSLKQGKYRGAGVLCL